MEGEGGGWSGRAVYWVNWGGDGTGRGSCWLVPHKWPAGCCNWHLHPRPSLLRWRVGVGGEEMLGRVPGGGGETAGLVVVLCRLWCGQSTLAGGRQVVMGVVVLSDNG